MRLLALIALQMFVGVLDHDDDRVHHRADGDGDAAQRHDVRADALAEHDEERNQHRDRQDQDGHERAAQVQQERDADQRHDDAFLDELFLQRLDRALNQRAAVVGDGVGHVRRQALHRLVEPLLHVENDLARVGAVAHDHNAADRFAFAVQLGDAAAHVGAELHVGDLAQQDRHAFVAHAHGDFPQVLEILDVAAHAQDEFLFRQLDGASADFAVAALDGHADVGDGEVVGAQLGRDPP